MKKASLLAGLLATIIDSDKAVYTFSNPYSRLNTLSYGKPSQKTYSKTKLSKKKQKKARAAAKYARQARKRNK